MENITKIAENEYEAIDPQTGGRWRVISPHALSEFGALVAIVQQIQEGQYRPGKGTTTTIQFEIKIAKDGEKISSIPGVVR
jgi:hypothetical protein